MGRVVIASFAGAIVCFIWGAVSWGVLDWHKSAIRSFDKEDLVAKALVSAASGPGVYMLPNDLGRSGRNRTLEGMAAEEKAKAARQAGPFFFGTLRPGAKQQPFGMDLTYAWAFLRSLAACFVVALMVRQTKRLDFIQKVGFCVLCGIFAGLVTDVPMFIWFEAPLRYTLINMADHLCEWFLAGLVIGALVQERETY